MTASVVVPRRRNPLPEGIAGPERPPAEGWDGVHIPILPRGTPSVQGGGSLRPRPQVPARRSRPGGRGATRKPSGDLRSSRFARPSAIFPHKHPDSNVHLRIGNGLRRTALESGVWKRDSKHTVDHPLGTGRCEADPRLDEAAAVAVEAVLDRTLSTPRRAFAKRSIPRRAAWVVTGAWPGHRAVEGFGSRFRATTGAFRGIYGPQDRPQSTISGLRGVRVGENRCAAESAAVARSMVGGRSLPPVRVVGGHEAGELDRDGPPEAVPGGARRGVFGGVPRLACRTLRETSQPTLGNTQGLARGWHSPPLRSPRNPCAPMVTSRAFPSHSGASGLSDRTSFGWRDAGTDDVLHVQLVRHDQPCRVSPHNRRDSVPEIEARPQARRSKMAAVP